MKKSLLLPFISLASIPAVLAHCPLCTLGAAAAAGGAAYLGVNQMAIGVFIGAFAVSMGWWMANLIPKKYVPGQRTILILASFLLTIIPMLAMLSDVRGFYLHLLGPYGAPLNRTYIVNLFLVGSLIGGAILMVTPWLSTQITKARGRQIPFQGMIITFALLLISAILFQVML